MDEQNCLDRHLADCSVCRKLYKDLQNISKSCSQLPEVQLPATLVKEVKHAIHKKSAQEVREESARLFDFPRNLFVLARWQYAGLAFVCGLLAIFLILPHGSNLNSDGISAVSLSAIADGEVAGMDLVFSYDPNQVEIDPAEVASITENFVVVSQAEGGTLRVSMASDEAIRLTGTESLLEFPFDKDLGVSVHNGLLRLKDVRAYDLEGAQVQVQIKELPLRQSRGQKSDNIT